MIIMDRTHILDKINQSAPIGSNSVSFVASLRAVHFEVRAKTLSKTRISREKSVFLSVISLF